MDKELYKHLLFLKSYKENMEDLCLSFQIEESDPITGKKKPVNLVDGGGDVSVTNQNVFRYVYLVMDYKLNRRIKLKADAFMQGFHSIIPAQWL